MVLLLDAQLLRHEFLLHFPLLELEREAGGLLLQLRPLGLCRLLEPHELLVILLTQEQLLLLDLLVHRKVIA